MSDHELKKEKPRLLAVVEATNDDNLNEKEVQKSDGGRIANRRKKKEKRTKI